MNTKRIVTLTLILTLSLVCLVNYSVASYPEGAWDLTTIATKATLEATHIVVGEVIHVSFVFYYVGADPLSIVTLRVDKDIKAEIEKDDTPPKYLPPPFIVIGTPWEGRLPPPIEIVSFVQVGGPWKSGGRVSAAGLPVLKVGDYVFLRLRPTNYTVRHNGNEYNSVTDAHGTVYTVQKRGDDIDDYIIEKGWQKLDFNVLDMIRIVRATLEQPETMRTLEREVNRTWRDVPKEVRLNNIMDTVAEIEETLNLPSFDSDDQ